MEYGRDFQDDDVMIALRNLSMYCDAEVKIDDINSFLDFYSNTTEVLKVYAETVGNAYILEKVNLMPVLDHESLDSNWKGKLKEISSICNHMLFTIENPIFFAKGDNTDK